MGEAGKQVFPCGVLYQGDCLEVMPNLEEKADLVLTDPPYGSTACKWDSVIPFDQMWDGLSHCTSERTPILLFGVEPFSSSMRISNIKNFKYDWIWEKPQGTGWLNVRRQPMRTCELISVFYKKQCFYFPQRSKGEPYHNKCRTSFIPSQRVQVYGVHKEIRYGSNGGRYPTTVLKFCMVERGTVHPTQKPVPLLEYLIRTYTREGDTVLDFTMGSGSTCVACVNTGRRFIGIEREPKYFDIAVSRVEEALAEQAKPKQGELCDVCATA